MTSPERHTHTLSVGEVPVTLKHCAVMAHRGVELNLHVLPASELWEISGSRLGRFNLHCNRFLPENVCEQKDS